MKKMIALSVALILVGAVGIGAFASVANDAAELDVSIVEMFMVYQAETVTSEELGSENAAQFAHERVLTDGREFLVAVPEIWQIVIYEAPEAGAKVVGKMSNTQFPVVDENREDNFLEVVNALGETRGYTKEFSDDGRRLVRVLSDDELVEEGESYLTIQAGTLEQRGTLIRMNDGTLATLGRNETFRLYAWGKLETNGGGKVELFRGTIYALKETLLPGRVEVYDLPKSEEDDFTFLGYSWTSRFAAGFEGEAREFFTYSGEGQAQAEFDDAAATLEEFGYENTTAVIEAQAKADAFEAAKQGLLEYVAAQVAPVQAELDETSKALSATIVERDDFEAESLRKDGVIAGLEASIQLKDADIQDLTEKVADLKGTVSDRDDEIAELNRKVAKLESTISERDATIEALSTPAPVITFGPAPLTAPAQ